MSGTPAPNPGEAHVQNPPTHTHIKLWGPHKTATGAPKDYKPYELDVGDERVRDWARQNKK